MATKASRIALAGSNISSTGEVDADLLDNIDSAAFLSLDSNGRLGIGTNSPAEKLEVNGSFKVGNLKIQDANGGRIGFNRNTANGAIYDSGFAAFQINGAYANADFMAFEAYTSGGVGTDAMAITSTGNIGIGTTSPSFGAGGFGLEVKGTGRPTLRVTEETNTHAVQLSATDGAAILESRSSGMDLVLGTSGAEKFRIDDSSGYLVSQHQTQVRLVLGSVGNSNNNTSNWIRGNQSYLQYNSAASGHTWEINGVEKMRIDDAGNLQVGAHEPTHVGGNKLFVNKAVNAAPQTSGTSQTGGALRLRGGDNAVLDMGLDSVRTWIQATDRANLANGYKLSLNPNGGNVGVGTLDPNAKFTVNNGHAQIENVLVGESTTMDYGNQVSSSADKSMAVIGSNSIGTGIALSRDFANTYPDFAVIDDGKIYMNNDATQRGNATYYQADPGQVAIGKKIISHEWKNWAGQGNYTARLYTPIVHNESNMFTIEIDVYGYGAGGPNQRYLGSGYAFGGSTLISQGTTALTGGLNHRLVTATHPTLGVTVVAFDIGYSSNNGTAYYNHMRWRYQGWRNKRVQDFVWQALTT